MTDTKPTLFTLYVNDLARWIIIFSLSTYIFAYIGCHIAKECFVRNMVMVVQLVRMLLVLGAILPCVVHGQVHYFKPGLNEMSFAVWVGVFLLMNLLMATLFDVVGPIVCKQVRRCQKRKAAEDAAAAVKAAEDLKMHCAAHKMAEKFKKDLIKQKKGKKAQCKRKT